MIDTILSSIKNGIFTRDFEPLFENKKSIVPGFVDTHAHMAEAGYFMRFLSLSHIKSKKDLLEYISSHLQRGSLNIFVDYDESVFEDEKDITKKDLDKISKDTPILLRRVCGHIAVLNTKGIEYFKDKARENTIDVEKGIAYEYLPLNLYDILSPSVSEIEEGIQKAQRIYLKKGITGILDFAKDINVFKAYTNLDLQGTLKIKVKLAFYEKAFEYLKENGLYTNWQKKRVGIEGIKLFLDGSVGGRTASFYKPYRDAASKGPFYSKTSLQNKIKKYEKAGFKVLVHAIGTRAIDTVLAALPEVSDFHHRIEHFEFPSKTALYLSKKKSAYISMQPNFVARWWKMYKDALYDEEFLLMHPYRTMMERGIVFAFGSDSMPEGPMYGLQGALKHPFKEERLSLKEAIRYYTEEGAGLLNLKTGKMARGFYGDFVVIGDDGDIDAVFVEGEKVYGR